MQFLSTIREDKLFSSIYIAGTAMSITFTMIMAVVYYIKLADIYPEVNRSRTIYLNGLIATDNNMTVNVQFNDVLFEKYCLPLQNVMYIAPNSLSSGNGLSSNLYCRRVMSFDGIWERATTNFTNQDFFNIYQFHFLSGSPFTEQDVQNHEHVAVLTRDFADVIFGKDVDPVGQYIKVHGTDDYRVCGVVKSASQLTPDSYANVYMPYTTSMMQGVVMASFLSVVAMVKDDEQLQALKDELSEWSRKMSLPNSEILENTLNGYFSSKDVTVSLGNNLETHAAHMLMTDANSVQTSQPLDDRLLYLLGVVAVLLLVPALNLCGIVSGRMERRLPEMGVRKSFGASKRTLLWQVIMDNMSFTLAGGLLGLMLTWIALALMRNTILELFFSGSVLSDDVFVTGEALFAPALFVVAFAAILILNVASAALPAYLSLRKPIVESLNDKQ